MSTELRSQHRWYVNYSSIFNINNKLDLKNIKGFLNKHYDDDNISMHYTSDIMKWCLKYEKSDFNLNNIKTNSEWNVGIVQNNRLIGFISAKK